MHDMMLRRPWFHPHSRHHQSPPPPPPLGRFNSPPPTPRSSYPQSPPPLRHLNSLLPNSRYHESSLPLRRLNSPPPNPNSRYYLRIPPPLIRFNSPPPGCFDSPPRLHQNPPPRLHQNPPPRLHQNPPPLGRFNSPPHNLRARYDQSRPPLGRFNSPPPSPHSRYHQRPKSLGRFNSPPPPGFRPFSNAPISHLYFRPRSPCQAIVSLQYLPNEGRGRHRRPFSNCRRYVDRTAGNLSPVAEGRGRHRRTRRRHRSPSASQSPNPKSPGRRPTSRTPASQPSNPRSRGRRSTSRTHAVQEVRQGCQSQLQSERSIRDTSILDDASSTAEGVSSRKLHKRVFHERTHLKKLAVADDQAKENQGQTSHRHQSIRGKSKAQRETDQISISDYAGSTAGDEGYIEGKFKDLITSEGVDHGGLFVADSQDEGIREGVHLGCPSQGQGKLRGACNQILEMTHGPSTGKGDIMQVESSMRNDLEAPVLADSQEARQCQEVYQSQPSPRVAKRQKDHTYTMEDASTSEGGEMRERKSQKLMSSEKKELEAAAVPINYFKGSACVVMGEVSNTIAERVGHEGSFIADSQDIGSREQSHLSQGQDKEQGICNQILVMENGSSIAKGDIIQVESQELMSSVRNELEAPFLADSQEGRQAQASNQFQPFPRKAKRRKDQVDSMENASSTSEGGEMRERMLQKLTSLEKNELEAATAPGKDSAPVDLAQRTSSFHDEADSCSLTVSSLFQWASTFDDVSSTDASYWGKEEMMVKVGNYFVDQKHSTTMKAIFKKYGDIAKDCRYTSTMYRSFAVRGVCEVVEGLQIPLRQLSHDRLDKYSVFVKEAAELGLSIGWLKERVDDVSKAVESLKEYKNIRDTRKGNMGKIEGLKKEIGMMVTKKMKCESEVVGLKCFLKAAKLEVGKRKIAIKDMKSRCRAVPKLLLDGLY